MLLVPLLRERAAKLCEERYISTISNTTIVGQEQEEASVKEITVTTSSI
jgi:hypothetical protein